jgi:hypothetical protein
MVQQDAVNRDSDALQPAKRQARRVTDSGAESDANQQENEQKRGPVLTAEQRKILYTALAYYDDTQLVYDHCRAEDPTFPQITPQAIRYHRNKRDKKTLQLIDDALADAVSKSLADKRVRVANLRRIARDKETQIRVLHQLNGTGPFAGTITNARTDPLFPVRLAELRQQQMAQERLYEQIAKELGQLPRQGWSDGSSPPAPPPDDPLDDTPPDELAAEIADLFEQLWDERDAMIDALLASQPPEGL